MKTLEKNITKLSALEEQELMENYGGFWAQLAAGILAAMAKNVIDNWDDFKAGLRGEACPS